MAAEPESRGALGQFLALDRDVLVPSLAMFAFSLAFQTTSRYLPEYPGVLGAGAVLVGVYASFGNLVGAAYPYPGGVVSDRVGSRTALTAFGLLSTLGFFVWFAAPVLGGVAAGGVSVGPWIWVFAGLLLARTWKSFGIGATFAVVKQSVPPERLAAGFAGPETLRRVGFPVGPALAAAVLASVGTDFAAGFRTILLVAVAFGLLGTVVQHRLYDASADSIGSSFEGVGATAADLAACPIRSGRCSSRTRSSGSPTGWSTPSSPSR